jgi:hypothetical protein
MSKRNIISGGRQNCGFCATLRVTHERCGRGSRITSGRLLSCLGRRRIRPIMQSYLTYFLRCACGHTIPLPHPTLASTVEGLSATTKVIRKAVFVCTECGLVSAYSSEDNRTVFSPTAGPHLRGELTLGYIVPPCDGANCKAPRRLYILGTGPAIAEPVPMKIPARDWRFSPSATCEAGHALYIGPDVCEWYQCDSPF